MTAPTTTPEITRYTEAVRAALADLSAEDRDDLMEDVEPHLAEVAAEQSGSLEGRLGPPADYAAELRTSAGLPVGADPARRSFSARLSAALAGSTLGRSIDGITRSSRYGALRAFLPDLRPGWWVLRGYLLGWVLAASSSGGGTPGLLPRFAGNYLFGLLVTLLAVWASVRLGRYALRRPKAKAWFVVANLLLIVVYVIAVSRITEDAHNRVFNNQGYQPVPSGLSVDGSPVTNIFVYDSQGRPLTNVQLFDQDGRALSVVDQSDQSDRFGGQQIRQRYDADGRPVDNVFPREPVTGVAPPGPFTAPHLAPSATPSPAPSAAASSTPSGAPSPSPGHR